MWTWKKENSEYWWNGTIDTKEEAIKEAKESGYTSFYVGECEIVPPRTDVDPVRIMEELDELYSDETGCDDDIYAGVTDEDRKWLEDKLSELMYEFNTRAKINPGWFKILSEEKITL